MDIVNVAAPISFLFCPFYLKHYCFIPKNLLPQEQKTTALTPPNPQVTQKCNFLTSLPRYYIEGNVVMVVTLNKRVIFQILSTLQEPWKVTNITLPKQNSK